MKVLVLNNAAPFVRGGAEFLAEALVKRLETLPGVRAELLRIPFSWSPSERLIEEILIHRSFRLTNADRVIGLKFPTYLIPHHHKTLWLLHQFRQAYDLADAGQGLGDDARGKAIKQAIRLADEACFRECQAIFVNSPVTQQRLSAYNKIASQVLYPPLNDEELFTPAGYGDYILAAGRVSPGKRQHLLIEAMSRVRSPVRLVVAGPPESTDYAQALQALVRAHGLEEKVQLRLGLWPREELAELMRGARACAYLPYDEDSLGYVTMEAFACAKAVLTTTDSGGLLELVSQDTGVVAEPEPASLAEGLERLWSLPFARRAGASAHEAWSRRGIGWGRVLEMLLG